MMKKRSGEQKKARGGGMLLCVGGGWLNGCLSSLVHLVRGAAGLLCIWGGLLLVLWLVAVVGCSPVAPPVSEGSEAQSDGGGGREGKERLPETQKEPSPETQKEEPPEPDKPSVNHPPSWPKDAPASWKMTEGSHLQVQLPAATDKDGDPLTYSAKEMPSFGTFEAKSRLLSFHPPYKGIEKKEYSFSVVVSDGKGTASLSLKLVVQALNWSLLWEGQTGDKPPWRQKPGFVFDKHHKRLIVFGGVISSHSGMRVLNDLWSFDGRQWKELTPAGTPPPFGGAPLMVQTEDYAVLTHAMSESYGALSAVYRLDLTVDPPRWDKLQTTPATAELYGSCLAYDVQGGRFLLFGGMDGTTGKNSKDLYSLKLKGQQATWSKLTLSGGPSARATPSCAMDTARRRWVIFSGNTGDGRNLITPSETWILLLQGATPSWKKLEGSQPPGRRNGLAVYDPQGKRVLLWSGTPDARSTLDRLWSLDLVANPPQWQEVKLPAKGTLPGMRSSGAITYDPLQQRVLIGFGNSALSLYHDLWALPLLPPQS